MTKSLGRGALPADFRAVLLVGWAALTAAGLLYARFKQIPNSVAIPLLAGFLVEYPFYLVPAWADLRKRMAGRAFPLFLALSFLLPYLACYGPASHLQFFHLVALAALAFALGLWYFVLPVHPATDLAFLTFAGAILLSHFFESVYPPLYAHLPAAILGRLALFEGVALVLMIQRGMAWTGYGFIPNLREWRIGALHYLAFLPLAACVAFPLKLVRRASPAPFWHTIGIFLAFLWVVALFEEFIFRGVLQQWLEEWTGRFSSPLAPRTIALLLTSLIFGAAHLWFRGFPNWRWALLAGILGWFCGHARNQAGGIRAGVVTHALVVATWRGFFV